MAKRFGFEGGVNYAKDSIDIVKQRIARAIEGYKINGINYGVEKFLSISNSLKEIPKNIKLIEHVPELYCTIGVHPHCAKDINKIEDLDILKMFLSKNKKIVAIGECGLDYDRMFSPAEKQKEVFIRQIEIAKEYNKPMYLHCRGEGAFEDMIDILNERQYFRGVVHCFTGNIDQAKKFIGMGFYLGITGWIYDEKRNKDLYDALQRFIPINRIMVETDAPWLSIDKTRKSEPVDILLIVERIAQIKNIPYDDAFTIITKNTHDIFL